MENVPNLEATAPTGTPLISVLFVDYQSHAFLDRAITSLRWAEPELSIEILAVDNGSPERRAAEEICRRHRVRLLRLTRNLGYGAAANRGLKYVSTPYVAVANPDITFERGSLSKLLEVMENNSSIGAVAPQLLYPDGTPQPSARRLPRLKYVLAGRRSPIVRIFPHWSLARKFQYLGSENANSLIYAEALLGTLLVLRTAAIAQVCGFDERFFMFAEDIDLSRRLRQRGWNLAVEPRARIFHFCGGSRQLVRRFTDYHRIKGLTLFLTLDRSLIERCLVWILGTWYYITLETMAMIGLYEHEYSWKTHKC
ncbi:MAG: glycosyltransferase family 2 protein [candidate division WOR-3 bacterium]